MADLADDLVGQKFGNYRLTSVLGKGGFAKVYLGEHILLPINAAIKVLHTHLSHEQIDTFLVEARNSAPLRHPNIVRILDFGEEKNIPYLVMDYAPSTLRQRHPRGTALPLSTIVLYVKQIAAALQYAHDEYRLIHRDVKPENMLLGLHDEILLSDFGIAQVYHSSIMSDERPKGIAGTVTYMAPEQCRGRACLASDQYALGVVTYEWLCGKPPFSGGHYIEVALLHEKAEPPSLYERIALDVPEIEEVIRTALSKKPESRFATVQAFADALEQASMSTPRSHYPYATTHILPQSNFEDGRKLTTLVPPATIPTFSSNHDHISTAIIPPSTISSDEATPAPIDTSASSSISIKREPVVTRRTVLAAGMGAVIMGSAVLALAERLWPTLVSTQRPTLSPTRQPPTRPSPTQQPTPSPIQQPPTQQPPTPSPTRQPPAQQPTPVPPGSKLATYTGHTSDVFDLTWSPDNMRIASGGKDTTVQIWEALSGQQLSGYRGHTNWVASVAWSSNGAYIVSGDYNGSVQVWDPGTRKTIFNGSHGAQVQCVAWSPDSKHVVSGGDNTILKVWDPFSRTLVFSYQGHTAGSNIYVVDVAWSPDGSRIASACDDQTVRVWDATNGQTTFLVYKHQTSSPLWAVAWSPDGHYIASGSKDAKVEVWDASSGKRITVYRGHSNSVNAVVWSPSGTMIASVSYDGTVQVWQALDGTHILTYNGHTGSVDDVMWSSNGVSIASCGADNTAQVWQAPMGE
jgi:WD40 repeat protein